MYSRSPSAIRITIVNAILLHAFDRHLPYLDSSEQEVERTIKLVSIFELMSFSRKNWGRNFQISRFAFSHFAS